MDHYGVNGQVAAVAASPGKTALAVFSSALVRAKIHYFVLSVGGTPVADNILDWFVRRFTVIGTSTPQTPVPLDVSAPASQLSGGSNFTAEPTFSGTIFEIAVHQRSLFQWNAAPGGQIMTPAVASTGVAITPVHASYNGSAQATFHWEE